MTVQFFKIYGKTTDCEAMRAADNRKSVKKRAATAGTNSAGVIKLLAATF